MTKKHFIALADKIRKHQWVSAGPHPVEHDAFNGAQLETLADFCQSQNPHFNRERWLDYIAGKCGP